MLGKQRWRLLSNASSLFTQVFKAKYFPKGDFLDAQLGYDPSFIWKSLLHSQVLFKKGARWRVGDKKYIFIWNDPWLKDDQSFYVRILVRNYTVKSGYAHMEDYYVRFDSEMKGNWDRLWKLQIPPKVRDFLWPIARNIIPTRERLQQKGLDVEDDCLFFGAHKDFVHVISIWSALNNLLWHGKHPSPHDVVRAAKQVLMNWKGARQVAPALESMGAAHRVQGRWHANCKGGRSYCFREALAWLKRSQLSRVLVETDSQEVAFAIQSAKEDKTEFGAIVQNCKFLLQQLHDVSVGWIHRTCNQVADCLAKFPLFMPIIMFGLTYQTLVKP
ncbi:hypothetical protein P3X46_022190 [Hevea brasiliensis]|uniref:RNase H type-1 domain-containing protein n=1 Tax=Hevea brasiliensis TaxID=3981 RepID=A0ABQ9LHV8_HEVBR|nr:hypothetical protein P3X46_022190 [Hevea brasiliensis]